MTSPEPVRWGILGAARIARGSFLPGLRAAGDGVAWAVAARELARAQEFARANEIERAYGSYQTLLDDETVDAVYVALPNALHAEWTIKALNATKAVLCEKPLTATLTQAEEVLGVASARAGLLWEAFVFLFREQTRRLLEVLTSGDLGQSLEVQTTFHANLGNREDIRFSADLGGGALLDVGCYCIRLGRLVFASDARAAVAVADWASPRVDEAIHGVLTFSQSRRQMLSCGFGPLTDSSARVLCSDGEITLSSPYHPREGDTMEIRSPSGSRLDIFRSQTEPSFKNAIDHIHRVLRGEESPRHAATDDGAGNAAALEALAESARRSRRVEISV